MCFRDEVVQSSKSLGDNKEISKVVRKVHPIFIAILNAPRKLLRFSSIVSEDEIEIYFQVEFWRELFNWMVTCRNSV